MRTRFLWDGQQRILTTIIFIIALSKFYTPVLDNFLSICCLSEFDSCEEDYQTLQDEFGDSLVPSVRCVYKNDREALSKILNQKFLHINEYTKNEDDKYTCKQTGDTFRSKSNLKSHVKRWTNYVAYTMLMKLPMKP